MGFTEYLLNHFTSIQLNEPRPLSSEENDDIFRKELSTWSKRKKSMYSALEEAIKAERKMHWLGFLDVEDHDDRSPQQLVEFIHQSESELLTVLSTQERDAYKRFAVPSLFPDKESTTYKSLPTFNAQFAQRWVALRAYEYGWNSRLFPNDHGEYLNRNRPMIERIGKKYQWLALFELASRLSDNVWAIGGWPEKAMVYDHPASHWFLRDVEPTLLMSPVDHELNSTWWQVVPLVLDPIDNNDIGEWPFQDEPPSESDWLDVIAPDGRPWTLLYGIFSIHEDRNNAESVELARLRDSFVRITTIVIPSKHVKTVITLLQDMRLADPSDHDIEDITDGPFLCEYGWRNTWCSEEDLFEEGFRNLSNITYLRPTSRHHWESHLDASLPDGSSICIPGQWLASRLCLRPHPTRSWEFITKEGELVFIDPSLGAGSNAALVDKGAFLQALKEDGLECLWIVAGEKSSYPSGHHGDYSSRSFAGVYRWVRGKWTGSQWHKDERGRPRS